MNFLTISDKLSGDYYDKSSKWSKNMYIVFWSRKEILQVFFKSQSRAICSLLG